MAGIIKKVKWALDDWILNAWYIINKVPKEEIEECEEPAYREIEPEIEGKPLDKMTPLEFEHFMAKLLKNLGYANVIVTEKSDGEKGGDYGADITAEKDGKRYAVQVKKWSRWNLVGADAVRSTLGSMWKFKADRSIIATTSFFTSQAYEQARNAPIELWNWHDLRRMFEEHKMMEIKR